jgi:hypothetical protein
MLPSMRAKAFHWFVVLGCVSATGCPSKVDEGGGGSSSSEGGSGITLTAGSASASSAATTMTDEGTGSMSGTSADATSASTGESDSGGSSPDGSTTDPTGGGTGGGDIDCGGTIYACGNGMDDDDDGKIDLQDPECTGPCDDDESSFQTGIPGDNMDCKQDCFFDGNSGQGDDGCLWSLKCDPENPGGQIGCEYTGGQNCNNQPPHQSEDCIMFCEQFVPPGCDCFGCCTVCDENGENCVDIFLNSGPDCSFDNLDACSSCTSQIDDCGTPCVPEECQICFGQTEPPEGCGGNMCPMDYLPCDADNPGDCPTDFFCYLGCCYPPPPG